MYPYPIKNLVFCYDGTAARFPDVQMLGAEQRKQLNDDVRGVRMVAASAVGEDPKKFENLGELPTSEMAKIIKNGGSKKASIRELVSSDFVEGVIHELRSCQGIPGRSEVAGRNVPDSRPDTSATSPQSVLESQVNSTSHADGEDHSKPVITSKLTARERVAASFNLQFSGGGSASRQSPKIQVNPSLTGRAKASAIFQAQVSRKNFSDVR